MITVTDWTRAARVGASVLVAFTVASTQTVASVSLDLIGDGLSGVTVSQPTPTLGGLGIVAQRAGTFEVVIEATDTMGCVGRTGVRRTVTVTR